MISKRFILLKPGIYIYIINSVWRMNNNNYYRSIIARNGDRVKFWLLCLRKGKIGPQHTQNVSVSPTPIHRPRLSVSSYITKTQRPIVVQLARLTSSRVVQSVFLLYSVRWNNSHLSVYYTRHECVYNNNNNNCTGSRPAKFVDTRNVIKEFLPPARGLVTIAKTGWGKRVREKKKR